MSFAEELDQALNEAFEFVVWGFIQLGHALAFAWHLAPADWPWWARIGAIFAALFIAPRLVVTLARKIRGFPRIFGRARFASLRELRRAGVGQNHGADYPDAHRLPGRLCRRH